MAKIGEYRLKAYELLYSRPLCDYEERTLKKNSINVLIMGNGWMGNEVFKAAFWAGQSVNTELNITVASQNASEYERELMATDSGAPLPALKTYIEQKHYANLRFIDIDVNGALDETGLAPLDCKANHYNYIVVSLGEVETNWLAASEVITQLADAKNDENSYTGKIVVNMFNEFSEGLDKDDQEALIQHGAENDIEVHFFGTEIDENEKELNRIARNINFAYAMKYDQRCNKEAVDVGFEESLIAEFINSPQEYKSGDLSVVRNFIGAQYSADSSFAAAVHIPMKLAVCKEMSPDRNALDTLKEAIRKKNILYRKLVAMEHRRWNAYTIIRGFRAPTLKEEKEILFHNGNTHQDKNRRLHICLCDCSEKITLENDFDRIYREWINRKCPNDFPSELDRASLRVHQLTGQLVTKINVKSVLEEIKGECVPYCNLRRAIQKLANDEDHSLVLYQKALGEAKAYASNVSEGEMKMIDSVDICLAPMKVHNARTDFYGLDQQLIEMLPFALWYGLRYKTVITVTDGSVTATSDVIVPTLFCAENAIYIGKTVGSGRYQRAVQTYFENRGANTTPQFLQLSNMDMDVIYECLEVQIQVYGAENIVINCVSNRSYAAALAVGKLLEKYNKKISVVQYLPNKGIISYSGDKDIGIGLNNKNYSLSEFIQLMGGCITNEYAEIYDSSQYDLLVKFFQKYCDSIKVLDAEGKTKNINPWAQMTKLLADVAKDNVFEEHYQLGQSNTMMMYNGHFSEGVFSQSLIGRTLNQLQQYRVIRNYTETQAGHDIEIQFDYVDQELVDLLKMFEGENVSRENTFKALKFIPLNGGLKVTNRLVQNAKLYELEEPKEQIEKKTGFMNDLARLDYILDLSIDDEGFMSFVFKDEPTMHLLKNQGTVFELIVYHFMRESGLFDDCETGVKLAWNADEPQPDEVLLEELQAEKESLVGYKRYKMKRKEVISRYRKQTQSVMNEVDVIGITGMSGIMVSCKTSENDSIQWLYEINSVSERFQSCGVMAISSDYGDANKSAFKERAKQMSIPLWGTETLWNSDRMREALQDVVKKSKQ